MEPRVQQSFLHTVNLVDTAHRPEPVRSHQSTPLRKNPIPNSPRCRYGVDLQFDAVPSQLQQLSGIPARLPGINLPDSAILATTDEQVWVAGLCDKLFDSAHVEVVNGFAAGKHVVEANFAVAGTGGYQWLGGACAAERM